jgi:NAD+ synthetase
MKLGLAQINPTVGDLEGNVLRILEAVQRAARQGAELVLLPELALTGCPPRDILYDQLFIQAAQEAAVDLANQLSSGPIVILGSVWPAIPPTNQHPGLYNAALKLEKGKIELAAAKRGLRSDDVFFESRWFIPGPPPLVHSLENETYTVLFGDDLYLPETLQALKATNSSVYFCLAASPFHPSIFEQRLQAVQNLPAPTVFLNLNGANDELIYDGRSFALQSNGQRSAQLASFKEDLLVLDPLIPKELPPSASAPEESLFEALVLGVRDFFKKNHLNQAFLGLSGGIDSALVAAIACRALGPQRVTAVSMPSRYTDPRSIESARELCRNLGANFELQPLETLHQAFETAIPNLLEEGTGAENIQARLRAMLLMAYVNRFGGLLLNTTNKTELCVGYITLYGDMAGMLSPIGDLTKLDIYRLAHWFNRKAEVIPSFILARAPSAELAPGQVDPFDYQTVSPQLEQLVLENRSSEAMRRAEYKRRQMGVILKVTEKAFGSGRLIPITRR